MLNSFISKSTWRSEKFQIYLSSYNWRLQYILSDLSSLAALKYEQKCTACYNKGYRYRKIQTNIQTHTVIKTLSPLTQKHHENFTNSVLTTCKNVLYIK